MSVSDLAKPVSELGSDSDLRNMACAALSRGWSACTGDITTAAVRAERLGWTTAPSRLGGRGLETLHATDQAGAHRNSMSARAGLGKQPLHSDGAHHRVPPDLVLLAVKGVSEVPTFLWPLGMDGEAPWDALRNGLFSVRGGSQRFLTPALQDGLLRFDPTCMTPEDSQARESARFLSNRLGSAVRHSWDRPRTILLINNRRVLHARDSVPLGTHRTMMRIAFHTSGHKEALV